MNTKYRSRVRVIDTKYFIDEIRNIVTCVMEVSLQMSKHPELNMVRYSDIDDVVKKKLPYFINPYEGIFKVKATVKCSEGDHYDRQLGIRMSEAKCKIKAFKTGDKFHKIISTQLLKAANAFAETAEACAYAKKVEENHLEVLNNEVCPKH